MDFTIHLTSQLKAHLRALRKARGLTQAALGQQLGVGQARIAEIENNPGVVSVDQLMKVLSALRASLVLRDGAVNVIADTSLPPAVPAKSARKAQASKPPAGQWHTAPLPGASPGVPVLRESDPQADLTSPSAPSFIIRPKKGSW